MHYHYILCVQLVGEWGKFLLSANFDALCKFHDIVLVSAFTDFYFFISKIGLYFYF